MYEEDLTIDTELSNTYLKGQTKYIQNQIDYKLVRR